MVGEKKNKKKDKKAARARRLPTSELLAAGCCCSHHQELLKQLPEKRLFLVAPSFPRASVCLKELAGVGCKHVLGTALFFRFKLVAQPWRAEAEALHEGCLCAGLLLLNTQGGATPGP